MKGVVRRRTTFTLVIIVGVVLALGAAWAVFYNNYVNQETPMTEVQERAKDSIQGQEQIIQESQAAPDGTKAAMLANLAQSQAYTNECTAAWENLAKAKQVAPPDSARAMERTEAYIQGLCPR